MTRLAPDESWDVNFGFQIGPDWPQRGQTWDFLRSVIDQWKLILKSARFVPFGAHSAISAVLHDMHFFFKKWLKSWFKYAIKLNMSQTIVQKDCITYKSCRDQKKSITLQLKPLITSPVITGKSPFFLPLCLCKIISPITGSQEVVIGYIRDFVADWRSALR